MTKKDFVALTGHPIRVYGAWLFRGVWDGVSQPPQADWECLRMKPGRFQDAPKGFEPVAGQVTLLGQGEHCLLITPD